jgi:hypothetical protein
MKFIPTVIYVILVLLVILTLQSQFQTPEPIAGEKIETLTDTQKEALKIVTDLNSLLHSLSIISLGLMGGFLVKKDDFIRVNTMFDVIVVLLGIILLVSSVYFGYILNSNIVSMLSNNMFDLSHTYISFPRKWQLNSFIGSAILFGVIVINNTVNVFENKKKKKKARTT